MKILVTGNLGYIGGTVVGQIKETFPSSTLVGLDIGYFVNCQTNPRSGLRNQVDVQYFTDVRKCPDEAIRDVDAIVYLAAISNDPMGAIYEEVTQQINRHGAVNLAKRAKHMGTRAFVYASSCSVYGFAEGGARSEVDPVNPLTAYAKSKVYTEADLSELADDTFTVTCLRFATACGFSERLRLDLVLNDFVASALATGEIKILSDGTPWRPLIHIKDMAKAIAWAIQRSTKSGGAFLVINTGSDEWNYQVKDLADAVAKAIPGAKVTINPDAQPDKRSYKVSFEKFKCLASGYQPTIDLATAIEELKNGLLEMNFRDRDFRRSSLIRLNVLTELRSAGLVTHDLEWTNPDLQRVAI